MSTFPLRKLDKYLALEAMMHVEYQQAYKFIFSLNNDSRSFLQNNFITIRNGFINCGLIPYKLNPTFDGFLKLEKIYFSALKRNI